MKSTVALTLTILLLISSCSVRRSEPIRGPLSLDDPDAQKGQVTFMAHCHRCHPIGESGLGPAINSIPAPDFLKRYQVRHGLGAMPSFSEEEISDEELDNIITYLGALQENE